MTSEVLAVRDVEHEKSRSSVATACGGVGWHWPGTHDPGLAQAISAAVATGAVFGLRSAAFFGCALTQYGRYAFDLVGAHVFIHVLPARKHKRLGRLGVEDVAILQPAHGMPAGTTNGLGFGLARHGAWVWTQARNVFNLAACQYQRQQGNGKCAGKVVWLHLVCLSAAAVGNLGHD